MTKPVKICVVNFWPGFSLRVGLIKYLFERALGSLVLVHSENEADIVLTSVFSKYARLRSYLPFPHQWPRYPEKSIAVIWENQRPNYQNYRFSLSSDFDSYGGRNHRLPYWYGQLQWPGMLPDAPHPPGRRAMHSFEPLVEIDSLLMPRPTSGAPDKKKFCCMIAANREPHRMLCVEMLSKIEKVDLFGPITGEPFQASKYELLSKYRFNLCFENSIFPGYYTEKMLQAWVGGCIPLYYSDGWYEQDFNPMAAVNRINYSTLDEFVATVAAVNASGSAMAEIFEEPLLLNRPTLDPAIEFLRRAWAEIM